MSIQLTYKLQRSRQIAANVQGFLPDERQFFPHHCRQVLSHGGMLDIRKSFSKECGPDLLCMKDVMR